VSYIDHTADEIHLSDPHFLFMFENDMIEDIHCRLSKKGERFMRQALKLYEKNLQAKKDGQAPAAKKATRRGKGQTARKARVRKGSR